MERFVEYHDPTGTVKAAVVTAVRDAALGKVQLTIFEPGGTLSTQDNVLRNPLGAPSTWRFPVPGP